MTLGDGNVRKNDFNVQNINTVPFSNKKFIQLPIIKRGTVQYQNNYLKCKFSDVILFIFNQTLNESAYENCLKNITFFNRFLSFPFCILIVNYHSDDVNNLNWKTFVILTQIRQILPLNYFQLKLKLFCGLVPIIYYNISYKIVFRKFDQHLRLWNETWNDWWIERTRTGRILRGFWNMCRQIGARRKAVTRFLRQFGRGRNVDDQLGDMVSTFSHFKHLT